MAKIVKVIELMSESPTSWEEAAQNAVSEASKTLRNIRPIHYPPDRLHIFCPHIFILQIIGVLPDIDS